MKDRDMLRLVWKDIEGKLHDEEMPMRDWVLDWRGECEVVPANDDPVYLAEMNGRRFWGNEEGDKFENVFAHAFMEWDGILNEISPKRRNAERKGSVMKKNKQAARNKKKAPAQAMDTIAPLEDLREVRAFTDPETGVQYLVYRTMDGVAMLPRFDASGRFKTAEDGDESKRGRDDAWEGVSLEEEALNARLASRILNDDNDR